MRRLLVILIALCSFTAVPVGAFAQSDAGSETPTDETIITLANDKTLSECVSALPKPDCRTADKADPKQLAILGILVAAMAFFGWKISRGVRARNGSAAVKSAS